MAAFELLPLEAAIPQTAHERPGRFAHKLLVGKAPSKSVVKCLHSAR